MSGCGEAELLLAQARGQVEDLRELIGAADEQALARPCRAKLGDGTVAACAAHTARNYARIAAYVEEALASGRGGEGFAGSASGGEGLAGPARGGEGHESAGGHGPGAHGGEEPAREDSERLLARLDRAEAELEVLGRLDDAALGSAPPAEGMRFADGRRTLREILEALLKHQAHQVAAISSVLG